MRRCLDDAAALMVAPARTGRGRRAGPAPRADRPSASTRSAMRSRTPWRGSRRSIEAWVRLTLHEAAALGECVGALSAAVARREGRQIDCAAPVRPLADLSLSIVRLDGEQHAAALDFDHARRR